jgi:hypothetical protein
MRFCVPEYRRRGVRCEGSVSLTLKTLQAVLVPLSPDILPCFVLKKTAKKGLIQTPGCFSAVLAVTSYIIVGACDSVVNEAVGYNPEGRSIESRSGNCILQFTRSFRPPWARAITKKANSVAFIPQANIPTERPPRVDEILVPTLWIGGCRMVNAANPPRSLISVF